MVRKEIWKPDSLILAIATLIGTIVGAGVLGLPYAIAQVGFIPGFLLTIIIFVAILFLNLLTAELTLRAKGYNQLPGIAEKYFTHGKDLMIILIALGMYGALIAYNIGIGTSLQTIFGGSWRCFTTIFFLASSVIVYRGLRTVGKTEIILSSLIIFILVSLSLFVSPNIQKDNYLYINYELLPSAYGVILFAFLGFSVVPQIEKIMKKNKKKMIYSIIIGLSICLLLYLLFSFSFVGVFGKDIKEVATESLEYPLNYIGTTLAMLAMGSSALILGTTLKDSLYEDFGFNKRISWFLAYFIPYLIAISGITSFTRILSITGKYSGGLTAIFVCFILLKARRKKQKIPFVIPGGKILIYLIIIFFALGMIII